MYCAKQISTLKAKQTAQEGSIVESSAAAADVDPELAPRPIDLTPQPRSDICSYHKNHLAAWLKTLLELEGNHAEHPRRRPRAARCTSRSSGCRSSGARSSTRSCSARFGAAPSTRSRTSTVMWRRLARRTASTTPAWKAIASSCTRTAASHKYAIDTPPPPCRRCFPPWRRWRYASHSRRARHSTAGPCI